MTKRKWKMSATALSAFKACPMRFRLGYVEGLRKLEDTEAQRMGTNWHSCLEVARSEPDTACPVCAYKSLEKLSDPTCPVCQGVGTVPEGEPMDRAVAYLNHCYATVPGSMDPTAWAVERVILAYSLSGYLWYYAEADKDIETIATEINFDLPLRSPKNHRALPNVKKVGKIDRLIRYQQRSVLVNEYKSTSKGIDPDSTYWNRLNMDTQIGLYMLAATELWAKGQDASVGMVDEDCPSGILYDVWHRPATRPKKLTQANTKKFMADGEYTGQQFEITEGPGNNDEMIVVNGETAEITPGAEKKPTKKDPTPERPFAIRETPEMFGARLLADIQENPEKHFARREVARTQADLDKVEKELFAIYQSIRTMDRLGHWYMDESQCEATFHCSYCPICYNNLDVFDGKTPVDGFRRIFQQETEQCDTKE